MLIAGIRMKGRYADSGTGFSRIGKNLGRYICGKPMLLHYDNEFRQDDADFERAMPVRIDKQVGGIRVRRIAGGRCVSYLHKGPYDQMGRSYAKILDYIRGKGYEVQMPTREIYIKGPGMIFAGNPRNYLTEIQILIAEAAIAKGTSRVTVDPGISRISRGSKLDIDLVVTVSGQLQQSERSVSSLGRPNRLVLHSFVLGRQPSLSRFDGVGLRSSIVSPWVAQPEPE